MTKNQTLVLLVAALALLLPTSTKAQCPELIWSDEFDGTVLDDTKWSPQIGDGCDLGPGMCGWGNNEVCVCVCVLIWVGL